MDNNNKKRGNIYTASFEANRVMTGDAALSPETASHRQMITGRFGCQITFRYWPRLKKEFLFFFLKIFCFLFILAINVKYYVIFIYEILTSRLNIENVILN